MAIRICGERIRKGFVVKLGTTQETVLAFDGSTDDASLLHGVAEQDGNAGDPITVNTEMGSECLLYYDGEGSALAPGDAVTASATVPGAVSSGDSVVLGLSRGTIADTAAAGTPVSAQWKGSAGGGGGGITLPLTTDLPFTAAADRRIYVQDEAGSNDGKDLTIEAGKSAEGATIGGTMHVRSGAGADGTALLEAADGGDLRVHGGDAGADGGAGGGHGGNVHIYGGLGTNAADQHGGVLIGEETTDEIRMGHEPVYGGINLGHIRHTGHFARAGGGGSLPYTVRFELDAVEHLVDAAPQVDDGGAGTSIRVKAGKGGNSDAGAAGQGGDLTIQGGEGGDGNESNPAGAGSDLALYGGDAGLDDGGGGAAGGNLVIDAGAASGSANDGAVYVGTDAARTLSTNIGSAHRNTNVVGLNNPEFNDANGNQTLKVADMSTANTAGAKLTIRAGKGNGTGNGGDLLLVGADRGASGTYGGSVIIDGGLPNSANAGVVLVGTNNGATNGATAAVRVGTSGKELTFNTPPQSDSVPTIASAATIAPTTLVAKVSGTTRVTTVTLPYSGFKGTIVLLPTGNWPWDGIAEGGNFTIAGTAVTGKALHITCDGTNWYPSYT